MKGTIKLNREFVYAYKRSKKVVTPVLVMHYYRNRTDETKFGITVSKAVGKANVRNRAKRLIREAFYLEKNNIINGYNLVFVARAHISESDFKEVKSAVKYCIGKSGIGLENCND